MEKFVNQPLKPRSFFTVSLSVLLATFATALGAQSVEAAKPMALRTIMERWAAPNSPDSFDNYAVTIFSSN